MALLSMSGITKSFAGVPALRSVDFELRSGEIHALLGANGAGKSTLMKVLSGAYSPDAGVIRIDDQAVQIRSPYDAKKHGIQCIYQEVDTALAAGLSVAENIMMDKISAGGAGLLNWNKLRGEAERALAQVGADIPVRKPVEGLTLAEKQLVLLARLLTEEARIVIFDEPTAPLSLEEAERLFRVMQRLKSSGIGSVFITHRLPEVFRMSDRITVMRDGERVLTEAKDNTNADGIIQAMLGKTFAAEFPKTEAAIGEILLEAEGLTLGHKVRDVSFTARSGEIVAVVGLVGAGKTELSRVLFGADRPESGTIRVKGKEAILREPVDAVQNGIVLVPEERRKQGILVQESVQRNISLPLLDALSSLGIVSLRKEKRLAEDVIQRLGIKTSSPGLAAAYLSGGNQQKVSIGKWLETGANVFLFDEPTKGVDIGAKSDIFSIIGELASRGKSIVYFTCEFAEAIGIADRLLVMYDGRLVKELSRAEATQELILLYASGGEDRKHEI
ncbi:sugar ABC transporter ATP-binding protein [Paenibacillus sambharensis]|uniref:Sugar ABC transporter ATP-binding protein n=1 Tax=Paenibacillus sambharensis TaxID=1803190 RepID=A0A2W1LEN0_9BACL|nr:sugar ABC transporter ATP-binding protein [Paenibacillus sambharensis]PZD93522.1 sugar ABC transporter ATP-binding protein [Paenibacillus sambharensis]